MNQEKLVSSIRVLRHFIDQGLGLSYETHQLTGFELNSPLLDSVAYNTYLETVGNKADTIYMRIKEGLAEMVTYAYLESIKRLSEMFNWKHKEFILAFDYTDEDFYGESFGFDIHNWTGKDGVTGKFKFLTCSIINDDLPQRIPLISIPIQLGHYKSYAVNHCLTLIKRYIGKINLVIFDRGFYDKDLMFELTKSEYPYLIFVPKHKGKKEYLSSMEKGQSKVLVYEFKVNKDKSNFGGETYLAFFRQIYSPSMGKDLDWVLATNLEEINLSTLLSTYRKRWRIETGFRVQDEAKIKCKSTDMKIRYFLFTYEQMLQSQWMCFYKEEVNFKQYIIEMQKTCNELVANPKRHHGKKLERIAQ